MERLNLMVDDGVKAALSEMAGSERKMGSYISTLVLSMQESNAKAVSVDVEQISYALTGLIGTVKMIEGRLIQVENELRQEKN